MLFKLIMVFVDEDKVEDVMDASRNAGATGATIISKARGQGLEKVVGILGFEILSPRAVVLILAEGRRAECILEAVTEAGNLDESLGTGIAIQLDVDKALGLSEHVKELEKKKPFV
ncbi:P-II family nitrogen regulator [Methylotuvimicrobium sp.]|uniref:P-II family nitrogen regulator n=1 Tax=Methylotuvimicrobium sp. TaxID=2822413 RepID=UPI003D661389